MHMTNEIINLKNVCYIRKGKNILSNITWNVNRGENWVLLGLNGSGKTTILNMINGYIFPSSGNVTVLGYEFGHSSIIELRKRIGWVSSAVSEFIPGADSPQHIILSGKYASFGLWEEISDDDIKRADDIMEMLNIIHLSGSMYSTLSQGEKQKVLIGRAMMNQPDIIILDEAFNGLDIFAKKDIEYTISSLIDKNISFILVTHNTDEILPVFNKVMLLKNGSVHSSGNINDIIQQENLADFYGKNVEIYNHNGRFYLLP